MKQEYNYIPLREPIPITEQVWPEGTIPLVSTLITAYNHEIFIHECIEGFLMQKTIFPVEIIIHDDASTDRTTEIIKEYKIKNPTLFKTIFQSENQYSQKVDIYNEFLYPKTQGKYIALCEGDDYWIDPLKLQKQVDFLEKNNNYNLIYTNFITSIDGINHKVQNNYNHEFSFLNSLRRKQGSTLSLMFRADAVTKKKMPKSYKYLLSGDLGLEWYLLQFGKGYYLKDITGFYRIHKNGISKVTNFQKKSFIKMIPFLIELLPKKMDKIFYLTYFLFYNSNILLPNFFRQFLKQIIKLRLCIIFIFHLLVF